MKIMKMVYVWDSLKKETKVVTFPQNLTDFQISAILVTINPCWQLLKTEGRVEDVKQLPTLT